MRIMYEDMKQRFMKILLEKGFDTDLAEEAAIIFTDNTCDGVASHGLNRFHRIGEYIEKGNLVVNATPEVVNRFGEGLSLMLDLLATVLSTGDSTKDIGEKPREYGLSQVFITIDLEKTTQADWIKAKVEDILSYVKEAEPIQEGKEIFYPSEQSAKRREENLREGIPVNEAIWNNLK